MDEHYVINWRASCFEFKSLLCRAFDRILLKNNGKHEMNRKLLLALYHIEIILSCLQHIYRKTTMIVLTPCSVELAGRIYLMCRMNVIHF